MYKHLIGKCVEIFLGSDLIVVRHEDTNFHVNYVTIKPTKFHTDEEGRQKVIDEQKNNVHAWVEGIVVDLIKHEEIGDEVNYNPYLYDYFFTSKDKKEYNSLEYKLNFQYETKKAYIIKDSNEKIR